MKISAVENAEPFPGKVKSIEGLRSRAMARRCSLNVRCEEHNSKVGPLGMRSRPAMLSPVVAVR